MADYVLRATHGRLGTYDYTANQAAYQLDTFVPANGGKNGVTLFVRPTSICDVLVYIYDEAGVLRLVHTEQNVPAGEYRPIVLAFPAETWVVGVTNTDNTAGSITVDCRQNG